MNVRDLMTEQPVTCQPTTGLQEVARMMVDNDCGAIPVMENDRPVGIITDRDITCRVVAKEENPLEKRAQDAMTNSTVTVTPDDSLDDAVRRMEEEKVRRLVVVDDNGSCVGIIAMADIARHSGDDAINKVLDEVSEPMEEPSEVAG